MLFGGGTLGLAVVALWILCIFDVIGTEGSLVRNLPKIGWLLIVIFVPTIGSIAWLVLGRPERAGWRPGDTHDRRMPRAVGPEDSPEFMAQMQEEAVRLRRWEDDLRGARKNCAGAGRTRPRRHDSHPRDGP